MNLLNWALFVTLAVFALLSRAATLPETELRYRKTKWDYLPTVVRRLEKSLESASSYPPLHNKLLKTKESAAYLQAIFNDKKYCMPFDEYKQVSREMKAIVKEATHIKNSLKAGTVSPVDLMPNAKVMRKRIIAARKIVVENLYHCNSPSNGHTAGSTGHAVSEFGSLLSLLM
jgi:hypothetical protein